MSTRAEDLRDGPLAAKASTVVARLTARRAVRSGVVWGYVTAAYFASTAISYADVYKTGEQRAQLAKTFGSNYALDALVGPAHALQTVAGFTEWKSLGALAILAAVWGLLTGTRLMRGEEEAGRWDLLLAGDTTRRRAATGALLGLGSGAFVFWLVTAVIGGAVGQMSSVRISVGSAAFFSLAVAACAALFLAMGALTSQLAATRRQAATYAALALGGSFALRMVADSGTGVTWLRWASPLGWVEQMQPLSNPNPWPLVLLAALTTILSVLAVRLAGVRDAGASIIEDRTTAEPRTRLLGNASGLAARLGRPVVTTWVIAVGAWAFVLGLVAKQGGSALSGSASITRALSRLGVTGSGAETYLGVTFLMLAVLVLFVVAGQVTAIREEEISGRLDHLLVQPLSRWHWLAARLGLATTAVFLVATVSAAFAWAGAAVESSHVGLVSLLKAGLNIAPPGLVLLGAGALAYACWPRSVPVLVYGAITWSLLIEIVGGTVKANHWVLDSSLFHQMAPSPAVGPDWVSVAVMSVIGVSAMAVACLCFARRDLAGT